MSETFDELRARAERDGFVEWTPAVADALRPVVASIIEEHGSADAFMHWSRCDHDADVPCCRFRGGACGVDGCDYCGVGGWAERFRAEHGGAA